MASLQLVVAAGLFSLGGVVLGALLTPLTQLFLENRREARAVDRAKLLVSGELLQVQLTLRTAAKIERWYVVKDGTDFLSTSIWRESRSSLAGNVSQSLWNDLIMTYSVIEAERARIASANELPPGTPIPAGTAAEIKQLSDEVGHLRRKLGGTGRWLDENP